MKILILALLACACMGKYLRHPLSTKAYPARAQGGTLYSSPAITNTDPRKPALHWRAFWPNTTVLSAQSSSALNPHPASGYAAQKQIPISPPPGRDRGKTEMKHPKNGLMQELFDFLKTKGTHALIRSCVFQAPAFK